MMRVNITLLGMVMVDCWRIYVQLTQGVINSEEQKEFYAELATELIDNNYDTIGSATKQKKEATTLKILMMTCWLAIWLVASQDVGYQLICLPQNVDNVIEKVMYYHIVSKKKTTFQCSWCVDDTNVDNEGWICMTKNEIYCLPIHL